MWGCQGTPGSYRPGCNGSKNLLLLWFDSDNRGLSINDVVIKFSSDISNPLIACWGRPPLWFIKKGMMGLSVCRPSNQSPPNNWIISQYTIAIKTFGTGGQFMKQNAYVTEVGSEGERVATPTSVTKFSQKKTAFLSGIFFHFRLFSCWYFVRASVQATINYLWSCPPLKNSNIVVCGRPHGPQLWSVCSSALYI